MRTQPISSKTHGILDYAISGALLAAPLLLNLKGSGRNISQAGGATAAIVNSLTNHSVGLNKKISLSNHKKLDIAKVAAMVGGALLTGTFKKRKARNYFLAVLAIELGTMLLTNWQDHND